MELAGIQQAIEQLPKDQRGALAAWLAERDFAPGGAGMALIPGDEQRRADNQ